MKMIYFPFSGSSFWDHDMSHALLPSIDTHLRALGEFAVRGFGARQQVFGLTDEI